MGFLESAGRGNAFAPINNTLDRAIEVRQLENRDAGQAFGRAIELDKLGMEKEAASREKIKFNYAVKEMEAKQAALDLPVPISDVLGNDYNTHPGKQIQFDYLLKNGAVKEPAPGVFMTTARTAGEMRKQMGEDVAFYKTVEEKTLQHTNSLIAQADAAMSGDKDALKAVGVKPEELPALRDKLSKQLSQQVQAANAIDLKHQQELEKAKAKQEAKPTDIAGLDPASKRPVVKTPQGTYTLDGQPYTPTGSLLPVTQAPASETKSVHLELPDPSGKSHPGGTLWRLRADGQPGKSPEDYIGPAPKSATLQAAQVLNEPLTAKEQRTVDSFVQGIKSGQIAPSQMNSFLTSRGTGPVAKMKIAIGTAAIDAGINLPEAEANYKAKSSSFAIQRVQLAKTVMPIADAFAATVAKIPDGLGFVPVDDFARKVGRSMNAQDLAALEFQKNKMVEEFERMLTGTQMADSRVQRNLELIKTGYDKKILLWMASEVKKISKMSVSASTSNMYPNAGGAGAGESVNTPSAGGKNSVLRNGKWVVE